MAAEDILGLAAPVLRHRLALNFEAQVEGLKADDLVAAVVSAAA